jgi:hypothetical protein
MLKRYRNIESYTTQPSQKRLKAETFVINDTNIPIELYNNIRKLEDITQENHNLIKGLNQKINTIIKEKQESNIQIVNIIDYLGLSVTIPNSQLSYIS